MSTVPNQMPAQALGNSNSNNNCYDEDTASTSSVVTPSEAMVPNPYLLNTQSVPPLFFAAPANFVHTAGYGSGLLTASNQNLSPSMAGAYPSCPSPSLSSCSNSMICPSQNPNHSVMLTAQQSAFVPQYQMPPAAFIPSSGSFPSNAAALDYFSRNHGMLFHGTAQQQQQQHHHAQSQTTTTSQRPHSTVSYSGDENAEWLAMQNGSAIDHEIDPHGLAKQAHARSDVVSPLMNDFDLSQKQNHVPFHPLQFSSPTHSSAAVAYHAQHPYHNVPATYLSAPASPLHGLGPNGAAGSGMDTRFAYAPISDFGQYRAPSDRLVNNKYTQNHRPHQPRQQQQQQQQQQQNNGMQRSLGQPSQPQHQQSQHYQHYYNNHPQQHQQQSQQNHSPQAFHASLNALCMPSQQYSLFNLSLAAATAAAGNTGASLESGGCSSHQNVFGRRNGPYKPSVLNMHAGTRAARISVDAQLKKDLKVNPVGSLDEQQFKLARYFIIKSHSTHNVEQAMYHGVWCSTSAGNEILDSAYRSMHPDSVVSGGPPYKCNRRVSPPAPPPSSDSSAQPNGDSEKSGKANADEHGADATDKQPAEKNEEKKEKEGNEDEEEKEAEEEKTGEESAGHVFLFFSVTNSRGFCGIAEMVGRVQQNKSSPIWEDRRWRDQFPIRWLYIKNVPNSSASHLSLPEYDNKPITFMRDAAEVKTKRCAEDLFRIFHSH